MNWLAKNGYGVILDSPTTAFGEYMDSELALAKEIEELVLKRRRLQEFDDSDLAPLTEYEASGHLGSIMPLRWISVLRPLNARFGLLSCG